MASASSIHAARYRNAAFGETAVHSRPGDGAGGEIAEGLESGEQAERRAEDAGGGERGDGGMLGGLRAADGDARERERDRQQDQVRGGDGETEVRQQEQPGAGAEDQYGSAAAQTVT